MSTGFDLASALSRLKFGRPLLIVDADEVLLRFVAGFDRFLAQRGLFLDLTSYRLHGNVKRRDDHTPVLDVEVTALLDEFRSDLDSLEFVEGAKESLHTLAADLDVVVLTNISPAQAVARSRNLRRFGLDLPIVANSGLKGETVRALAATAGRPSFFVDDIPQNLASAAQHASATMHAPAIIQVRNSIMASRPPPCTRDLKTPAPVSARRASTSWALLGILLGFVSSERTQLARRARAQQRIHKQAWASRVRVGPDAPPPTCLNWSAYKTVSHSVKQRS